MNAFKRHLKPLLLLAIGLCTLMSPVSALNNDASTHARLGLEAAARWPGYASLCDLDSLIRDVNSPRTESAHNTSSGEDRRRGALRRDRTSQQLPPMQVFDNLYFLGTPSVSAWLYGDEQGYLLIDGLNNDEEARKFILGGMKALGLDPQAVQGVLVTHAHGDHYGGADYVAEKLGVEIMMSQADWELAARLGNHPRFGPPPEPGVVLEDGQTIHFGASALDVHITPGHTPGTISPIFRVYDDGNPHSAVLWGGTGFNFGPNVEIFEDYAESAARMRKLAREAGVDVFISNHAGRDGSIERMAALSDRQPDEPHPFIVGVDGYSLFTVLEQCALAQAARFQRAPQQ